MKKLTDPKLSTIYREASAHISLAQGCGCCYALNEVMEEMNIDYGSPAFNKVHDLFKGMFKPRKPEGGAWWWRRGIDSVEPRRIALLIAAEEASRGTITDYN